MTHDCPSRAAKNVSALFKITVQYRFRLYVLFIRSLIFLWFTSHWIHSPESQLKYLQKECEQPVGAYFVQIATLCKKSQILLLLFALVTVQKKAYWKAVQLLQIYPNTTEKNFAHYHKLTAKLYLFRVKTGQDLPD